MRFAPETLFVFLASVSASAVARSSQDAPAAPRASAAPTPSASPSPTPRYKLIPYGFETAKDRSARRLLRFEDKVEVRSLEMNAAIARFFDQSDEKGNTMRGATPGGAPTLRDMASYRHQVSPSVDLLGIAVATIKEIRKQIRKREAPKGEDELRRLLLAPAPTPTPSPSPSPSPVSVRNENRHRGA